MYSSRQALYKNNVTQYFFILQKDYAVGTVNDEFLFNITVPSQPVNGFVGLGTDSFGLANYDNFMINPANKGEEYILHRLRNKVPSGYVDNRLSRQSDTLYFKPFEGQHIGATYKSILKVLLKQYRSPTDPNKFMGSKCMKFHDHRLITESVIVRKPFSNNHAP